MRCFDIIKICTIVVLIITLIYCWIYADIAKYENNVGEYISLITSLKKNAKIKKNRINLPIYYINLERAVRRNYKFIKDLELYNLKGVRVSAIDAKNLDIKDDLLPDSGEENGIKFKNVLGDSDLAPAELSCTLSHLKAVKQAYDDKHEIVLIVEDDCSFDLMPYWDEDLSELFKSIKGWDIIQLGSSSTEINETDSVIPWKTCYWGTFAIAYTREGLKRVLDKFYKNGTFIIKNFDEEIIQKKSCEKSGLHRVGTSDYMIYLSGKNVYTIAKPLFVHTIGKSTIHNDHDENTLQYTVEKLRKFHPLQETQKLSLDIFVPAQNKPILWQVCLDKIISPQLKKCHTTVSLANIADFHVILVTLNNIKDFLLDSKLNINMEQNLLTELVVCRLLHHYGGIYVDIHVIGISSLFSYFKLIRANNLIYSRDGNNRGEEIGTFIASRPNIAFTKKWQKKILTLRKNSVNDKFSGFKLTLQEEKIERSYEVNISTWNKKDSTKSPLIYLDNIYDNNIFNKLLNQKPKSPSIELLPGINAIIYINLNHRNDRKKRFIKEFQKLNIFESNLERVEAIYDGENGALGCLQSHIKALEMAIDKYPNKNVLICEDDIVFVEDKKAIINKLKKINHNAELEIIKDVLMLAHYTIKHIPSKYQYIVRLIESQTGAAYLAHTDYLKKILDIFKFSLNSYNRTKKWHNNFCVDQCWKELQFIDNWFGINPAIAIQGASYSDIEKMIVDYKA